ncbi:MAG TPA: HD-GYP domain-containing protein [Candidatus Brocadiia bacterium]|nr:HD-GYP domain-containing protein [Planctomycetota bacterium]MDO8094676.1 HD-GYP domain-containing protein [Candidatus Brocadiales bacterium]
MEPIGEEKDGMHDADNLKKLYKAQEHASLEVLYSLADAVDARNAYTTGHSKQVTVCATNIARVMGLKKKELDAIKLCGPLHDIGKIAVKEAIIGKPGKLSEDEFSQIKIHPLKGYRIIEGLDFLGEARLLALHHHERFDGKGYPYGLKGEEIPLGARILATADAIDAMTSDRPYRKALDIDMVLMELDTCSGTQFDPKVVNTLLKRVEQKPEIFYGIIKPKDI